VVAGKQGINLRANPFIALASFGQKSGALLPVEGKSLVKN
jgi:hypothetical protein